MESENYVYKKEIDWSTLMEGFTLPLDNQVIFLRNMENFLQRGQSKIIHFQLNIQTIADEIIQLPVNEKTREVDWYYMEQFMQGILNVAESTIESLKEFVECTE